VLVVAACQGGASPDPAADATPSTTSTAPPPENPTLLGAFYHLWNPENLEQGYLRARLQPPQLAPADQAARGVAAVEEDIAQAAGAGIDFFALDYWPSQPDLNRRIDERFLAAANAGDIRFCLFYETQDLERDLDHGVTRLTGETRRRFVDDIVALGERYFDHPGYLRVGGRPVLILYLTRSLTGDVPGAVAEIRHRLAERGENPLIIGDEIFWRVVPVRGQNVKLGTEPVPERALAWDALTAYNFYDATTPSQAGYGAQTTFLADVAALYGRWREALGGQVPIVPSVIPGYNDLGLPSRAGHPPIPRQWEPGAAEGSFFDRFISEVALPAVDPRLPMVLVTSWNEWNEDTGIEPIPMSEPTATDDSPSGRDLTAGYNYAGYGTAYLDVLRRHFGGR
jgi:hypothetical protein